jgi:hypothetical protein
MLPCNIGGHAAYQDFVVSEFLRSYPDPFALPKDSWDILIKFWYLDLSATDTIMEDCYSIFGPPPRPPSSMMRSYLLSLKLKVTSVTDWCRMLKETPLYAIVSGFMPGDTPGVGTFYDFFHRMWGSDRNDISPKERFPKLKVPKGKKKGGKTPAGASAASRLLPLLERWDARPGNPFALIFRLYNEQFLQRSVGGGLIVPAHLAVAGDGTPVRTAAQQRKKRLCNCPRNGNRKCRCKREYSQPDCNWGWDSHRECYFFGYHLYMYVASDSVNDLPVFPLLERASRHDMLSFLHSFFTMKAYLPGFNIEKLLLDAAHDSIALYDYCKRKGITPFIDLNPGNTGNLKYKDDFTIDEDGVPICKIGLRMRRDGNEPAKHRAKYRCPLANRKRGCFCGTPCSDAKYGRTMHIFHGDNPRLFNIPPRGSDAWKKEYNARTSVERSNKREKSDYKLEGGRHRSTMMWYCRLYGIMMLQHLDAWEMPTAMAFQESLLSLAA